MTRSLRHLTWLPLSVLALSFQQAGPASGPSRAPIADRRDGAPAAAPGASDASLGCAPRIRDQATAGCLEASSLPRPGLLFPPPHDGGTLNTITGQDAFVGSGRLNRASGDYSTISGGYGNTATSHYAGILGGANNASRGVGAAIAGGIENVASGAYSVVGGGVGNQAVGTYVIPWDGSVRGHCTVGGGWSNTAGDVDKYSATVGGGSFNQALGSRSTIGGGSGNATVGIDSTVAGGNNNLGFGSDATVSGGTRNKAWGVESSISGGFDNNAHGRSSTIGGGVSNTIENGSYYGVIAGGDRNRVDGRGSVVGGGGFNTARDRYSTVGGGKWNTASGFYNDSSYATVAGGSSNQAASPGATIGGGQNNWAAEVHSTIPGGYLNRARGRTSFAAGRRAKADHDGSFVWGDSVDVDKLSSADDEFNVYAAGGTRIFSNSSATTGVLLAPGAGTWTSVSDRDAKENVAPVDGREVLAKICALDIGTWNYKAQGDSVRHMGPMAQDVWAAFELGLGETTIDTVDADGITLAAIQGLHAELMDRDEEIEALRAEKDAELDELRSRVAQLESMARDLAELRKALAAAEDG